jgi:hypothetical protein
MILQERLKNTAVISGISLMNPYIWDHLSGLWIDHPRDIQGSERWDDPPGTIIKRSNIFILNLSKSYSKSHYQWIGLRENLPETHGFLASN